MSNEKSTWGSLLENALAEAGFVVEGVDSTLINEEERRSQDQDRAFTSDRERRVLAEKRNLAGWVLHGDASLGIKGINNFNGRDGRARYTKLAEVMQAGSTFETSYIITCLFWLAYNWKRDSYEFVDGQWIESPNGGQVMGMFSSVVEQAFHEIIDKAGVAWAQAYRRESIRKFAKRAEPVVKSKGMEFAIPTWQSCLEAMTAFAAEKPIQGDEARETDSDMSEDY